ncbi:MULTISPECIES: reverse transcriptase family protein [unclassified Clostridium]|uniref:reverse transcriptase family protein n=1 Tax=unclassified Clostridium TaxID=2614128 RepID=UPI0013C6947C|nr:MULTISPECIES: reverse transcriptase family protein [unclassified Clostridium]NFI95381.1 RNA-directed DNA polymerase [Clostridium botulinum]NFO92426.1 RNA-directed DNA polymerase [Clostridium botulinum]
MMENQENNRKDYREAVNAMGKKEFTLIKMQEYGFWPQNLPTPYERQENETSEQYENRKNLLEKYEKVIDEIANLYEEKDKINSKLIELQKKYDETWDYEKIRLDVSKTIMEESIARRAERKKQRELEKRQRSEEWKKEKEDKIVFIGKGYSSLLKDREIDKEKLLAEDLPIINDDKELASFLGIEYKKLRFLVYHRDVVSVDHYYRYTIPKKRGGVRNIAAPKSVLKNSQRKILDDILLKIPTSDDAHGFLKGKSVVSAAKSHFKQPELLINIDLEDFFPTITFERVRGLFKSFGYSGYIASMLAMLCTYCERMKIEVRGEEKYIKTSNRILPQGSPASPMITNIICIKLDKRLKGLSSKYNFTYTRYADDMSFSFNGDDYELNIGRFIGLVSKIVKEEGFNINKDKTKFLRKNNCQCITGIVINNEEIGVPKKWVKKLRAAIYNANKAKNSGEVLSSKVINEISGMTSWIKSVNEKRYKAIIDSAMELINS